MKNNGNMLQQIHLLNTVKMLTIRKDNNLLTDTTFNDIDNKNNNRQISLKFLSDDDNVNNDRDDEDEDVSGDSGGDDEVSVTK